MQPRSVICTWQLPYAVRVAIVCEAARNGTGSPSRTAALFLRRYLEAPGRLGSGPAGEPVVRPREVCGVFLELAVALAEEIAERAKAEGIPPEQLVRDLFLAHLPEFVADALSDTLSDSETRPVGR